MTISGLKKGFGMSCTYLSDWFMNTAYPTWFIDKGLRRVREYNIKESNTLEKPCNTGVPFTITFHPLLRHASLIVKKNLLILYLDQRP